MKIKKLKFYRCGYEYAYLVTVDDIVKGVVVNKNCYTTKLDIYGVADCDNYIYQPFDLYEDPVLTTETFSEMERRLECHYDAKSEY